MGDGRLDGKVALVSGASRGMGEATARRFVAEGGKVVLGDILEAEGEAVADELGDAATFTPLDVTSEQQWLDAVALAESVYGHLDVLVNNAGILAFGTVADMPEAEYRRVIDVNQVGVFLGMKAAVPALLRAAGGSIINMSSVEGLGGSPMLIAYTASKFAVRGMTKAAAMELGQYGIRVNSVHPGAIDTDMVRAFVGDNAESAMRWMAKQVALQRPGEPSEVAALIAFLASDDSSYCTGGEFIVDGGAIASAGFKA